MPGVCWVCATCTLTPIHTGDEILRIDSKFLTMDWRNNPAEGGVICITEKAILVSVVNDSWGRDVGMGPGIGTGPGY